MNVIRTLIALLVSVAAATSARADILYGVTGAGGSSSSLYTLNASTGQATLIGAVTLGGNQVQVSSIAYHDGQLYGATSSSISYASPNTLLKINTDGTATPVGSFGGPSFQGISFNTSGTLYGYAKQATPSESLWTINTTTGSASLVGASNIGFTSSGDGFAVSPTGTIYLAPGGAAGQANAKLYTLNSTTGVATAGSAFSGALLSNSQMKGMAFDGGGTLYGLNFASGSPFRANLVRIHPSAAAITDIGATTDGMNSLAFAPSAVPEPGPLLLLAPFVLAAMIVRQRRARLWKVEC